MSAIKGRRQRSGNLPKVLLQGRVEPAAREKAHRAAAALGISVTAYLEQLLLHDELDDRGRPLWWTEPLPPDQGELPLSRSA